jgi:Rrf2 family protein
MKRSEGVEWALHCTAFLAALPKGATLSGRALSEFHGVPESYLLKHLKLLAKAGLLEAQSGPKGGYRLARPAGQITLLEVVQTIEGRQPDFRCTEIRQRGPACLRPHAYHSPCAINATMLKAEAAWRAVLSAQTLAELVATMSADVPPETVEKTADWLRQNVRGVEL